MPAIASRAAPTHALRARRDERDRHVLEAAVADAADPDAADLLGDDEPRLFEHTDVLLHAREGHVELFGKLRDRSVRAFKLLQNAASGCVRERGE